MKNLLILYIGSLDQRSNSFRRFASLLELCPLSDAIDTDPYILNKLFIKVQYHFNFGPGIYLLNKKVREKISQKRYDIIYVDNKPYLTSKTLLKIKSVLPEAKIADVLTDDPFGQYTRSWSLLKKTASYYDVFFVQRKVNIEELKNRGVKHVEICYRSYDPEFNKPVILNEEDKKRFKTEVGFVGSFEDVRASYIAYLIQNGIPVSVTGAGWKGAQYWEIIKPYFRAPFVYGADFIKTICGMDIALHFLRHANRDEQDSRTFEIPSSGAFMLAEKSSVHLSLFEDKKEAVFFNSKEELLQKVKYYLIHPEERIRIANAGLMRCLNSGYSHKERLKKVLETIVNIEK